MESVVKYIVTMALVMICAWAGLRWCLAQLGAHRPHHSPDQNRRLLRSERQRAVFNDMSVSSGNKANASAIAPITLKNSSALSGILGGGSRG